MAKTYESNTEEFKINQLLKTVIDPEIGINIVDLGLVYTINLIENKSIGIEMTLSTPACPLGDVIISNVEQVLQRAYLDYSISVNLVWEPEWNPKMVSPEGKETLDLF